MKPIVRSVSAGQPSPVTSSSRRAAWLSACVAGLAFASSVQAQVIAQYLISSSNDDTSSLAIDSGSLNANVAGTNLIRAGLQDFTPSTGPGDNGTVNGVFFASGWETSTSPNAGIYFQFSLTAQSGYQINFSSLTYALARSLSGPTDWQVHYSTDGFVSSDVSLSSSHSLTNGQQAYVFTDTFSLTTGSTTTLRIYGFNDTSGGSTGNGIGGGFITTAVGLGTGSELLINGTVSAIPEPTSGALVVAVVALAAGISRRRLRVA